jgi:HK97 family phage prohead protease
MKNRSYGPAKIRSASYDADANTVEIIWSTGADVVREDYDGQYIERLSMDSAAVRLDRLNSGAPFLDTHDSNSLASGVGNVVPGSAKVENGKGVAVIRLSTASGDADAITKIREGTIKSISVGYIIHASTRTEGEKGQPDIVEVVDWEPLEVSAVPIPADPGAYIRAHRQRPRDRQTPAQRAATYARSLLTPSRTSAEARGAAEARRAIGTAGRMANVPNAKNSTSATSRRALAKREVC